MYNHKAPPSPLIRRFLVTIAAHPSSCDLAEHLSAHCTSLLVQAMPSWAMKTPCAPSRLCRDAGDYGLKAAAVYDCDYYGSGKFTPSFGLARAPPCVAAVLTLCFVCHVRPRGVVTSRSPHSQVWDVSSKEERKKCVTKLVDVAKARGVRLPEVKNTLMSPEVTGIPVFHALPRLPPGPIFNFQTPITGIPQRRGYEPTPNASFRFRKATDEMAPKTDQSPLSAHPRCFLLWRSRAF